MKKGWLIYTEYEARRNEFFIGKLTSAARKYGLELKLLLREKIALSVENGHTALVYEGKKQNDACFAVMRVNDFTLSFQLEKGGLRVFNRAETAQICNDKYLSYLFANSLEIPTLDTFLIDKNTSGWQDADKNLFPLVAKPLDGKGGKDVLMLDTYGDFLSMAKNYGDRFLLQKVAGNRGVDVRAYCIGGRFFTAIKRASLTDFRSNYCLGGSAEPFVPDEKLMQIIEKILSNLKTDYVGIDFVFDDGEPYFNEMEDAVGARTVYNLTDLDPADAFIKYVSQNI